MIRSVSIGWGGRLHIIDGARIRNCNLTFVPTSSENDPISPWRASLTGVPGANWLDYIYGGDCSLLPGGLSNHRPGAWYHDKFYFSSYNVEDTPDLYILSWDGSGIHKHGGFTGTNGYAANWRNGRGTELISPSGAHDLTMQSCAHIVHNGILFILGSTPFFTTSAGNDPWRTKTDWDVASILNTGDGSNRRKRRRYIAIGLDKRSKNSKDHKFITTPSEFLPNATTQEDTNACDAISWDGDILFASYCDLVRYPGGSGLPSIIESTLNIPTSKCFELFPTSGFDSTKSPIFDLNTNRPDILVLTGSGVLKKINLINSIPSGTTTLFDLGSLVTDDDTDEINIRTSGPLARVESSILEPTRSCYLKSFNGNLHAFIISAASGYHYFRCDGDPTFVANWSNKTVDLPDDFKRFDGDIYGYFDNFKNSLYLMHVSKSEYGIWGITGGQKGAGGINITQMDENFNFTEIYRGMSAEPPIGLLPYNNLGVSAQVPSGGNPEIIASTDYILVNYKLYSAFPVLCNVNIEYSIDDGISWHSARRFKTYTDSTPLGDGFTNLLASYFDESYTFYWDHINDIGCNSNEKAIIRITPEVIR